MERILKKREFRAFIHSFSEGIVLTDAGDCVCWINPMAEDLLGVRAEAWTSQPVDQLLRNRPDLGWIFREKGLCRPLRCWDVMECTDHDCPLHGKPFTDCWSQKRCTTCFSSTAEKEEFPSAQGKCAHCKVYNSHIFHREKEIRRPEGEEIMLHSHTTPLYDENGIILGSIHLLRDITKERELGRKKDEFLSAISHELRSPLTSIRSYTEILMHYANETDPETQKEFLEIIHAESDRLDQMIEDMTELQQLESARMAWNNREISLPQILQQVLQDLQRTLTRKQILTRTEMDPACPALWADPDKIYHVASSLLRILVSRTPKHGTILIRVQPRKGQRRSDSDLFVRCTLTTLPLPAPEAADTPQKGSELGSVRATWDDPWEKKKGLTLTAHLCETILEQYGGRLSPPQKGEGCAGYTFHFTLPVDLPVGAVAVDPDRSVGVSEQEVPSPEVLPPIEKAKKGILIVDDDPRQINSITFALKKEGYKTYPTTSSSRALEMARELKPDLIISDIRMPEMDGYALLNEIKKEPATKGIPFFFISEPKEIGDRIRSLKSGVDDYMAKPYDLPELVVRVEQLLRRTELQQTLSRQDGLTGALTRKAFEDSLSRELRKAQRDKSRMALVMVDIDLFKDVNDTHGHLVGDFVLYSLVKFLEANLREEDILGRYGGEEFFIIMPGASKQTACEILERIRNRLAETKFHYEKDDIHVSITCSFGVSGFPSDSASGERLMEKSDIALYRAKHLGRNRVIPYRKSLQTKAASRGGGE